MNLDVFNHHLRYICSILDFDIAELWVAEPCGGPMDGVNSDSSSKSAIKTKFIQLYTSPTYNDYYSLLIKPHSTYGNEEENSSENKRSDDEEIHIFSPIICRGVCDGGQIVWTNTRVKQGGLINRPDLPLNTAIGVPMCSFGNDIFIAVLYAVKSIPMTPIAVEILCNIVNAITTCNIRAIKPVHLLQNVPVTAAKTEQYVGVWDMAELITTYSQDIAFHSLPIGKLQAFYDYQELSCLKEVCSRDRSDSISSTNWKDSCDSTGRDTISRSTSVEALISLKHSIAASSNELVGGGFVLSRNNDVVIDCYADYNPKRFYIDARRSYSVNRPRFHEFMVSVIGMTLFDVVELCFVSDATKTVSIVSSVFRDKALAGWCEFSKRIYFDKGIDVPGQVYATSQPYWDIRYSSNDNSDVSNPRASMAEKFGLCSALGVPLPGNDATVGILCLYSKTSIDVDLLLMTLIQKAMMMLSASELDTSVLEYDDVENLLWNAFPIMKAVPDSTQRSQSSPYPWVSNTVPDFVLKVNMMGSLALTSIKNSGESHAGQSVSRHSEVATTASRHLDSSVGHSSHESLVSLVSDICGGCDELLVDTLASRDGVTASRRKSSAVRKCMFEGCVKQSQGTTLFCIAHGGGRRCTFPGCDKGARGKLYCSKHGGGKRCLDGNCTKSAVGGSDYCTTHGGGKRCLIEGCTKSAQSSTDFCVKHGGGRLCCVENCNKCARGKTDYCAGHGSQVLNGLIAMSDLKRKASMPVTNDAMKRQK